MQKKRSLIILLANVPWDWSTDYVNQTAQLLSREHLVFCFFWWGAPSLKDYIHNPNQHIGLRKLKENLYLFQGVHFLPLRRFHAIESLNLWINIWFIRSFLFIYRFRSRFTRRILWFFDPRMQAIAKRFGESYSTIYDCVDYYRGDARLSKDEQIILREQEDEVIRTATLVTVNSKTLYTAHKDIRRDIVLVPQGFRNDVFSGKKRQIPQKLSRPIVGYIGAINDRLNYPLLHNVARSLPHVQFLFAGPIIDIEDKEAFKKVAFATRHLFTLPNVSYIGAVSKKAIPGLLQTFSLGIIPYREDDSFNTYAFPMKVLEYFHVGLPVLSSEIKELHDYPKFVTIARTEKDWVTQITAKLQHPLSLTEKREERAIAYSHRWEQKIHEILTSFDDLFERKKNSG